MEFLLWIASILGAIITWEVLHMGLDWWGLIAWPEWRKWGREDVKSQHYKWSYRLGPLQIFRM